MARSYSRKPDRVTAPDRLSVENSISADYLIGPVDRVAREMDLKWGDDRLPDLVGLDLAERFGRQREKWERAVASVPIDIDAIREQAPRMIRAWQALDAEAERLGAPKHSPEVWEFRVDGRRTAVIRDAAYALRWAQEHPDVRVYSLDEIGRVLGADYLRLVDSAKAAFPGATVKAIRPRTALAEMLEDDIPFMREDR